MELLPRVQNDSCLSIATGFTRSSCLHCEPQRGKLVHTLQKRCLRSVEALSAFQTGRLQRWDCGLAVIDFNVAGKLRPLHKLRPLRKARHRRSMACHRLRSMPEEFGHSRYEDGKHVAISVQRLDAVNNTGWNLEHVERSQRVRCPAHGDDYSAA